MEKTGLAFFFEEGGWGMWPTTLFGFLLVAAAVLYAVRPRGQGVPLLVTLALTVLGSGVLGTTMGVINTLKYVQKVKADEVTLVLTTGFAESLNNLVLTFVFLVMTSLVASVGALRAGRAA